MFYITTCFHLQLPVLRVLAEVHNIHEAVPGRLESCDVPDPGLASWGEIWSQLDGQWLHPWPRACSRSCQCTCWSGYCPLLSHSPDLKQTKCFCFTGNFQANGEIDTTKKVLSWGRQETRCWIQVYPGKCLSLCSEEQNRKCPGIMPQSSHAYSCNLQKILCITESR